MNLSPEALRKLAAWLAKFAAGRKVTASVTGQMLGQEIYRLPFLNGMEIENLQEAAAALNALARPGV